MTELRWIIRPYAIEIDGDTIHSIERVLQYRRDILHPSKEGDRRITTEWVDVPEVEHDQD